MLRWARRGTLVNRGMKKVRDPRNSTAAEKVKVFRIGLESEGAAKDMLTYPFKTSHQNLLDGLAKKLDGGVGKLEAERRARLRLQGGQLLQAKRSQVMTQRFVLLDRPLSIGIAAFLGPFDQKSCRPAERKPCPGSGRK